MENQRFDIAHIRKYVKGELSNKEMYILERASQEDQLLMDLIQGIEIEESSQTSFDEQTIKRQILSRTAKSSKKIWVVQQLALAASVLLIIGVGYYFFGTGKQKAVENNLAQEKAISSKRNTEIDTAINPTVATDSPLVEEDNRIAALPESTTKNRSTIQQTKKSDIKNVPRIKINKNVPGIDSNRENLVENENPEQLAAVENSFKRSPIIEIHTNKASALAANARISARKTQKSDTVINSIYGYTTDQDSPSKHLEPRSARAGTALITTDTFEENESSQSELQEFIVTKKNVPRRSEPIIGWEAYRDYLEKATNEYQNVKGEVNITLSVNNEGQPENFKIIEPSTLGLSDEAISIIKNGPKWIKGRRSNSVKLKIQFGK